MMPRFSESDIVTTVRTVLPDIQALTLFGSRADGTETAQSDLDLAVLLSGPADPVGLWEAGETIASRLDVDVDLIDLRAASTVMQFRIITTGRRLFTKGNAADIYDMFIVSEMLALNEARAPLIADILREGRVYGG